MKRRCSAGRRRTAGAGRVAGAAAGRHVLPARSDRLRVETADGRGGRRGQRGRRDDGRQPAGRRHRARRGAGAAGAAICTTIDPAGRADRHRAAGGLLEVNARAHRPDQRPTAIGLVDGAANMTLRHRHDLSGDGRAGARRRGRRPRDRARARWTSRSTTCGTSRPTAIASWTMCRTAAGRGWC